jgi:hypothetical protein
MSVRLANGSRSAFSGRDGIALIFMIWFGCLEHISTESAATEKITHFLRIQEIFHIHVRRIAGS